MRYFYQLLFLLCFGYSAFSQFTVKGIVLDEHLQTLQGSHIQWQEQLIQSDAQGSFLIHQVAKGDYSLKISHPNYQIMDTVITVVKNEFLQLQLTPLAMPLQEIKVQGRAKSATVGIQDFTVNKSTVEKYSNQTLGDALKEIVGVTALKSGGSIVKPIIHGLHSSRVPVFSNQVRMEDQQWGIEHAPNFDVNSAGKITVIKGASALQYSGDAVGGMILAESPISKKDTLFGKVVTSFSSNGRGGTVNIDVQKGNFLGWRWNMGSTFKYLGDKSAPDYILSNTGNREINFSGTVSYVQEKYEIKGFYSYYNARLGILSASHIGNVTDLYNAITHKKPLVIDGFSYSIQNPYQEMQHHLGKINFTSFLSDAAQVNLQYAFQYNQRNEYDVRRGDDSKKSALDLSLMTHSFLVDYEKKMYNNWTVKAGTSWVYQDNYANPKTGVRPLIPTFQKMDFGIYALVQKEWESNLMVETGIRYDFTSLKATKYYLKSRWEERNYSDDFSHFITQDFGNQWLTHPRFSYHNFAASIGFLKKFTKNWDWNASVALTNRNPNPSELFSDGLHHAIAQIELGDLRLRKEQSVKLSTSVVKQWQSLTITLNPFVHYIDNFIFLQPIGVETTTRGAFLAWEYRQANAQLLGVDFQSDWYVLPNLKHQFSLAYLEGHNKDNNSYLIDIPPMQVNNGLYWSTNKKHSFTLGIRHEWVFEQKYFPDYNFSMNIIENNALKPVVLDVSTPPKSYSIWHLESSVEATFFKKNDVKIALFVQNIMNTSYRDYLNRQRFFAYETGRNIQIQMKINF